VAADTGDSCNGVFNEPFTAQELVHARDMLVQAHSDELVINLERKCRDSRQRLIDEGKNPLGFIGYIDDDTYLTTESYDVCLRATATWIRAVNLVLDDPNINNMKAAMALTRPPGHHATAGLSNGFCVFNFAAAAAIHAIQ
jgi:acetoin utilization deacetylase AcuC-like enzyme